MPSMPQLVLTEPHRASWADVSVPTLTGPVDALVRPVAVASCDLDTAVNAGAFPLPLPYALGHEFVAEVREVADGVRTVRPGDVVGVPFQISCGECANCRAGLTRDCAAVPPASMYGLGALGGDWGGAMSELVRVPYADAMLVPLPAGVDPVTVASLDNLPDAWRTIGPYVAEPGTRVLVVGRQSIGLYAVAIGRALGADMTYVDRSASRLALAERFGATVVEFGDAGRLGSFPVTVSTDATAEGLRLALNSTARSGVCTDTGIFVTDPALPLQGMFARGVTFVTSRPSARTDLPAVLRLITEGRLDPSLVTDQVVGWDDAAAAWSAHSRKLVIARPLSAGADGSRGAVS